MNRSALNARLLSAAKFVRQDATFADVGTDHGYLPLFLLEEGRVKFAYCSDINEGPLSSAKRNAVERGADSKMEFILTDGIAALSGRGITDYAVCGMGGELIADIIERAPHLKNKGINLILQPMSKQAHLRSYLAKSGFEILEESYSFDAGKYYVCLLATYTDVRRSLTDAEAEIGRVSNEKGDTYAEIGYIKGRINALSRALEGKKMGGESIVFEEEIIKALNERLTVLSGRER